MEKLSKEDAEIVRAALYDMVDYERTVAGEELDKTLQKIKDAGMEVNTVDKIFLNRQFLLYTRNIMPSMEIC